MPDVFDPRTANAVGGPTEARRAQVTPLAGDAGLGWVSSVPQDRLASLDALVPRLRPINGQGPKPFSVFLGAGVSRSAGVPLAGEVVRMIEEKCADQVRSCKQRDYSRLMECLLPAQRYELLKDCVNGAKLNVAHLYLAALVKAGWVDTILTTNFDSLVLRALAHANVRPNVYDVPNTKNFDSVRLMPPAVVYLHGQFNSFITVHTLWENKDVLEDLKHALWQAVTGRTLIVIGYSGENDPMFAELCKPARFSDGLFWVHYKPEDPGPHVLSELLAQKNKYAYCVCNEPADRFFPRLAARLNVQATHIAFRPFSFLKEALDGLAAVETDQGTEDIASDVRGQVTSAICCFEQNTACSRAEVQLKNLRRDEVGRRASEAWLEGTMGDGIAIEADARKNGCPEALLFVAKALNDRAVRLEGEAAIEVCDAVVARFGKDDGPALKEQVAKALVNKGFTLGGLGRSEDAIEVYDDVAARFGTASEAGLRELVARALLNKALRLGQIGLSDDAIKACGDVAARFGTCGEPALRALVGKALINQGVALGHVGRSDDEIRVYDDIATRFDASSEPALRELVAKALINKGITLGQRGRSEDEITVYDDVLARFGAAEEGALRGLVAMTLINKAIAFGRIGRCEDEIKACDDVAARFGTSSDAVLRELVAKALAHKAITLCNLGRGEAAIAVCDDVAARFGQATEPGTCKQVARALGNRGWIRYLRGDHAAFLADTTAAVEKAPRVDFVAFNLGLALLACDRDAEALAAYRRAREQFPETKVDLALGDLEEARKRWLSEERAKPVIQLLGSLGEQVAIVAPQ